MSLGVGTGDKDRHVIRDLVQVNPDLLYIAVDISAHMLRLGASEAMRSWPNQVLPIELDFDELQLCTVDIVDARELALLREVVRRPDGHFALAGEQLERLRSALDAHSTALHAWGLIGGLVVDPLRRVANRLQWRALHSKDSERPAQPPPVHAE